MKIRVKFSKTGSMKFIGHLDVMRYFQKAIRRSGLDIAYSQGFNPHQLISFAAPLGVGLTSDGEYMDMQMNSSPSSAEGIRILNEQMNDEIRVKSYVLLDQDSKNAMSVVAAADYCISLKDGYELPNDYGTLFQSFWEQNEINVWKQTKKSERMVDIKPYIYAFALTAEEFADQTGQPIESSVAENYENGKRIFLQLTTGSVVNIKPELVMEAFCEYAGIPFEKFAYQIHRMEVYADLNADPKQTEEEYGRNRKLVPLSYFGKEIA